MLTGCCHLTKPLVYPTTGNSLQIATSASFSFGGRHCGKYDADSRLLTAPTWRTTVAVEPASLPLTA